jgi:4-amino-4-deoxy-L-arabinose transferase-like glycosyltransferase
MKITPKSTVFWLSAIFLLAVFLRLFNLGSWPSGFHVDEAKVGWNSYSLFKTGRDDWGHAFPLYYNTFGDFRPTGYFYAAAPALALFGLTEFAVRFTPAVFGSLSVLILFFLTLVLTQKKSLSLLAAFLLAISPWHVALSRASSEGIISLALTLLGMTFYIRGFKYHPAASYLLSAIFLTISYFFYHTFRLLTPPLIFITFIYYSWPINLKKISWLPFAVLCFVSVLALLFVLDPQARGRFSQVSIFSDLTVRYELDKLPFEEGPNHVLVARIFHNKLVLYSIRFITEYSQYFSSSFLIGSWGSKPLRYVTVDNGPVSYTEFFVIIIGLVAFIKFKNNRLPLYFLLLAPVAAALTTEDAPNLSRALFMSPLLCIFAALGLDYLKKISPRLRTLILVLLTLNFIYFWHMYSIHNSGREEITMNRNSGVTDLMKRLPQMQKDYYQVILTNIPDSLYPWYAFSLRLDPGVFNSVAQNRGSGTWQFQNVVFSQSKCPTDSVLNLTGSAVFVDAEGCPDRPLLLSRGNIIRTSGGPAYKIWSTD